MGAIIYSDILRAVYHTMTDGKRYSAKDLLPSVKEACGYTDDQMKEMTKGDTRPRVEEYVRWALAHLYGAGLIWKVERGVYEIVSSQDKLLTLDGENLEKLVRAIAKRNKQNQTNFTNEEAIAKATELFPKLSGIDKDWLIGELAFMDTAPDKATITKGIRSLLVDAEDDISIEELQKLLKEAIELRSIQYELEVKIQNKGNKRDPKIIVDFIVKDNKGNKYPFKLETIWTAIYLTFLYSDKRIFLDDFCNVIEKSNKVFQKIYDSLYNKKGSVKSITYDPSEANTDKNYFDKVESARRKLTETLSKIRIRIADAMPNDRTARLFVIADKDVEHEFSIQATNQTIRDLIKKQFSLN